MAQIKNYTLNFGPQHPAAHGVLRLVLELAGLKLNIKLLLKLKVLTEVIGWLKVKYKSVAEAKTCSWS